MSRYEVRLYKYYCDGCQDVGFVEWEWECDIVENDTDAESPEDEVPIGWYRYWQLNSESDLYNRFVYWDDRDKRRLCFCKKCANPNT